MKKAIIVDHLSYLNQLKNISFTVQKGELVGIIGSTNSGKQLILKLIAGLVKGSTGFVSVLDYDPYLKNNDFLKKISYINNSKNDLSKDLPPIEILENTKLIYGLSKREFNKNLDELARYIKNPQLLDSLIYKPEIVLLDNPDYDLESVYSYINKNEYTALVLSDKIDNLINLTRRIIIIDDGLVIFDGALDEILNKFATEKIIKIKLSSEVSLKSINEIIPVKKYNYPFLYVSVPRTSVHLVASELLQNLPIQSLEIEELSVDEIVDNMKHDN